MSDGSVLITSVAATGKWAAYIGASWIGKTTIQAKIYRLGGEKYRNKSAIKFILTCKVQNI